jgi:hypothetical protein
MTLAPALFARGISLLKPHPAMGGEGNPPVPVEAWPLGDATPDPADRREALRLITHLHGDCWAVGGPGVSGAWPARTADISEGGLGLLLSRRFEPGTVLAVTLARSKRETICMPLARVRCVRSLGFDWKLGCAWANGLTIAELAELLGPAVLRRAGVLARTKRLLWLTGGLARAEHDSCLAL